MERSEQNQLALHFQKVSDTESGKIVFEALRKFAKEDVSILPLDNLGRIDPYMVVRNEGKRAVWVYTDTMLKKNINEEKVKEANNG